MLSIKEFRSRPQIASAMAFLALLGSTAFSHAAATERETIVLATGPRDGVYHRLAEQMLDRLDTPDRDVRVEPKHDCAESLAWLEEGPDEGEVRFAFAQQDVVGERFRAIATPVRVVDRIAYDYLHIFVRRTLTVQSLTDLAGRKVWLGEEGSAVRFTALHFLERVGGRLENVLRYQDLEGVPWERGDLRVEDTAVKELSNWLNAERLDAAILVAPAGSPEVLDILRRGRSRLLSLTPPEHRRLLSQPARDPFLRHLALGSLPEWTYENQEKQVSVAAVPILLLTSESTDPELAKAVRQAARDARDALRLSLPEPAALASPGLKWLEGLESEDRQVPAHLKLCLSAAAILGVLGLGIWQQQRVRRWYRRLRRSRPGGAIFGAWYQFSRALTVTGLIILVCMLLITWPSWRIERKVNEHFSTFWEAWWSITLYIFSGLDQARAPYTPAGRILGAAGLALGWILSIGVTGKALAILIRRERKMPPRLKDHLVLLNWNERGMDIVDQLHHPDLEKHERTSVIVVLSDDPNLGLAQFARFPEVYPRIGDPTSEADLKQVNAHAAHTVLILADERRGDEWAIRSVLKLRNTIAGTDKQNDKQVHVIVELIEPANSSIIEDLAQSFPGHLEAVSDRKLRTCVIAQAALLEGIADFYMDLLSVGGGENNEVYAMEIPESAVGRTFRDYSACVLKNAPTAVIPIGIHRKTGKRYQVITNPGVDEKDSLLRSGDRLIVIAYGPPEAGSLPPYSDLRPQPAANSSGGLSSLSQSLQVP